MNVKIASAPIPGLIIGTTICKNVFASLAPSICAASSISEGTPSENCFIRNTPNGHPTIGKITAQIVLYKFRLDISRSNGIKITCFGNAIAHTINVKSNCRPTNLFFASAYPAMDAVIQVRIMDMIAMNTVLISQRIAAGTVGPVSVSFKSLLPVIRLLNGILNWNSGAV